MFRFASRTALLLLLLAVTSCNYGLTGAGGFPSHVRTVYIAPFENKTSKFELNDQLARELSERVPRALGVRVAGEDVADAVIRGVITQYRDAANNYRPGQAGNVEVLQHQVEVTVSLEIVDVRRNAYIWERSGVTGRGEYRPDTQTDEVGRATAIQNVIQQIIDGAQSQW